MPDPVIEIGRLAHSSLLSIVLPAWNETAQIAATIRILAAHAAQLRRQTEIVLVDDGSVDGTLDAARRAVEAAEYPPQYLTAKFLRHETNRGKGAAIRTGLAAAAGDPILLCDADLSTPIGELARLEAALAGGADVVIASRDRPESRLDPPQPLPRRLLAWTFRSLRRTILLPEIRDTQCGFKLLSRRAVNAILPELTLDGWLYDCELLALARDKGFAIHEIGVTWQNRHDSRVRLLAHLLPTLRELLALRRRFRTRRK